ncbi:MAG TPA: hypothetical protein VE052_05990 [Gemmatimonadaceae bacterium]|nr:hypothetical protein [Gemmatimonadaceae bacterium]
MNDLDNAPISEKDRTLYAFIRKMVRDSTSIGQEDVDVARKAGWSDEALYDAITVCSLFQFYNNWIDATGVGDMSAFGYEMSGHRLASHGYAREPHSESRSETGGSNGSKGRSESTGSKTSTALKSSRKSKAAKRSNGSSASTASTLKRSNGSSQSTASTTLKRSRRSKATNASRKSRRPTAKASQGRRRG